MPNNQSLKILLAVDGSRHSDAAVALTASTPWPAGTTACVVAVAPMPWSFTGLSAEAQSVVEETLAKVREAHWISAETLAARTAEQLGARGLSVETAILEGRPSEVILQHAADCSADLIVIGAKGLSAPDAFHLGSTAQKLAEYANCSVLIARPLEHDRPRSLILAADGSPEAQRAAHLLRTLSLSDWVEVIVVSVAEATVGALAGERRLAADVPADTRRDLLDAAETRAAATVEDLHGCGAQIQHLVRVGHPAAELLALTQERDADLVVLGAFGQDRASPFGLGGVAQKVVKYAPCSVLLVR